MLVIALAAVAGGAGALLMSASAPRAGATRHSAEAPVNVGATDVRDVSANNSPVLVRNPDRPSRVVVVNRVDQPDFSCAIWTASDGGVHWKASDLPVPAGDGEPVKCFAPDAAYGAGGALYVSFVTLAGAGNNPRALWVTRSADDGATFSPAVRVAAGLTFQAHIVADALRPEVWVTWLAARDVGTLLFPDTGYPIVASRSSDGGRTWSAPAAVSDPARMRVVAPVPRLAGGSLYVLYLDLGDDALDYNGGHQGRGGPPYAGRWSLVLARSADGGSTWTESVVAADVVPTERFVVFLPPLPSIAVDGRRVYVAFEDGRLGDPDVWLWTSTDGGTTFAAPVRVNDTKLRDGRAQYFARIAVAPNGRLDILYYDRRSDPNDVLNEASLQWSDDHGRTFSPRVRLSGRPFDSRIGFGSFRGLADLGSANALLSTDTTATAVWTDTRAGAISGKQDLARGLVSFRPNSPLVQGGKVAALVLGGVALAAMIVLLRQREQHREDAHGLVEPA